MTRPAFGRRHTLHIDHAQIWAARADADPGPMPQPARAAEQRRTPLAERVVTWSAYYSLVFTAIVIHTPDTAVAAVRRVGDVASGLM